MSLDTPYRTPPAAVLPQFDPVVSRKQTCNILGVSMDTLDRLERAGEMPGRVRLSTRRFGYRLSSIELWLTARTTEAGR